MLKITNKLIYFRLIYTVKNYLRILYGTYPIYRHRYMNMGVYSTNLRVPERWVGIIL